MRSFVNWRKLFLALALVAGEMPSEAEKQTYYKMLRAKRDVSQDGYLLLQDFIDVDAWFDVFESSLPMSAKPKAVLSTDRFSSPSHRSPTSVRSPSQSLPQSLSDQQVAAQEQQDTDDDDLGDVERLENIKTLLFNTYRIQNRPGMQLEEFIRDLDFVFKGGASHDGESFTLYHSLLQLRQ